MCIAKPWWAEKFAVVTGNSWIVGKTPIERQSPSRALVIVANSPGREYVLEFPLWIWKAAPTFFHYRKFTFVKENLYCSSKKCTFLVRQKNRFRFFDSGGNAYTFGTTTKTRIQSFPLRWSLLGQNSRFVGSSQVLNTYRFGFSTQLKFSSKLPNLSELSSRNGSGNDMLAWVRCP